LTVPHSADPTHTTGPLVCPVCHTPFDLPAAEEAVDRLGPAEPGPTGSTPEPSPEPVPEGDATLSQAEAAPQPAAAEPAALPERIGRFELVTASYDGTLKVWDTATGQELLTLMGHAGTVRSVSFTPDGKRLVSASNDRTVKVWEGIAERRRTSPPSAPSR
jgi:hypothetical protein